MRRSGQDRGGERTRDNASSIITREAAGKAGIQTADISGKTLGRMIEAFMKLPGIGRKSAERLAFAVLGCLEKRPSDR
jgi:3-methyladenine DNA glycosylase/8-oxoguanine DNA glycosylase